MIREMRAVQLDLAARAPFSEDGQAIRETRSHVNEWAHGTSPTVTPPATRSATALAAAERGGFIEVG